MDHGEWEISHYVWSPDSRYLAYEVHAIEPLHPDPPLGRAIQEESHEATEPAYNSSSPAWDPKGKYLYFLSDRYINPFLDRFEARFIVNDATLPCVLALQADGKLPFAPRGDTDPEKKDQRQEGQEEGRRTKTKDKDQSQRGGRRSSRSRIDFEGLMDRFVQVPVEPGRITRIWPRWKASCIG